MAKCAGKSEFEDFKMIERTVALVVTSCNRFDLLEQTLRSFFEYNTYEISQHIIIEDSHNLDKLRQVLGRFPRVEFTILNNDPQIGQMRSIEKAYSKVVSDYIFHCEDDWEFYRPGFIEASFKVLDSDAKIVTVWLREQDDTNNHPVEPELFECLGDADLRYQIMMRNFRKTEASQAWCGFTFNPGLRRLADYRLIAPMGQYPTERAVSEAYYRLGFKAAIFPVGYVRHIGYHRGIRYGFNQNNRLKDLSVWIRRMKSSILGLLNQ
jgi:hypothetical protein